MAEELITDTVDGRIQPLATHYSVSGTGGTGQKRLPYRDNAARTILAKHLWAAASYDCVPTGAANFTGLSTGPDSVPRATNPWTRDRGARLGNRGPPWPRRSTTQP